MKLGETVWAAVDIKTGSRVLSICGVPCIRRELRIVQGEINGGKWRDDYAAVPVRVVAVLPGELDEIVAQAKGYQMSKDEEQDQRLSFAYGNTKIENDAITRESIREAAERLDAEAVPVKLVRVEEGGDGTKTAD